MNLLDLMVKIAVEDKASSQVDKTSDSIKSKLATAAKAGVAAVATLEAGMVTLAKGLYDATEAVAKYGDEVDKTSQKVGLSAEAYQRWDYVMNISGTSMQSMTMGLKTLTNKLDDAKSGSTDAQEKFAALGISMEELGTLSREELFERSIKGFQGMADSTERAALANDLFGRSGQELAPLFNATAEETDRLLAAADQYGMVMSGDAVKASAAFVDAQTTMEKTMAGVRNRMVGEFLPSLTAVMQGITDMVAGNVDEGKEQVAKGITDAANVLKADAPKMAAAAVGVIRSFIDVMKQNGPAILDAAVTFFGEILQGLGEVAPDILVGVLDLVLGLIDYVVQHIPDMLIAVGKFLMTFLTGIAQKAPEVIKKMDEMVQGALKAVVMFVMQFFSAGAELVGSIIGGIGSLIGNVAQDIWNGINDAWNTVLGFVGDFFNAGANIVQGIIDGIGSLIGNVASTILGGFRGAISTVKSVLGIASPSKVFRGLGRNTMEGFVLGVEDMEDKVNDAVGGVMGGLGAQDVGLTYSTSTMPSAQYGGQLESAQMREMVSLLRQIAAKDSEIYLDGKTLVGGISSRMDNVLGNRRAMTARGLA